jgi:hypothetical protein
MARIDWDKEGQRLHVFYASMEDGELNKIATELDSLSDVARETLRAEMSKRNLQVPPQLAAIALSEKQQSELPQPDLLRRYRDLPQAMIAKSILDSAGIESFLADDNLVRMDWFYSNLIGGIKLLVRHEDAEAAMNLLDLERPEKFDVEGVGEYDQPKCPECGAMDITFDELDKQVMGAGLFLGLPIKVTKKGWTCHLCGHRWGEDDAPAAVQEPPAHQ